MHRLPIRLLLFLIPLAAVTALGVAVLVKSGETRSAEEVGRQTARAPVLYGLAYTERDGAFKRGALEARTPSVVCLGSSRVLGVRSEFFKQPGAYYNAGIPGVSLYDALKMLKAVRWAPGPRLLLLGMDSWWYNDRCPLVSEHSNERFFRDPGALRVISDSTDRVLKDALQGKIRPHFGAKPYPAGWTAVGLAAHQHGAGFRSDGSYQYEAGLPREWPGFAYTVSEIHESRGFFTWGTEISPKALQATRELLRLCREQNVHVAAFVPPYAASVYHAVEETPHFPQITRLRAALGPVFAEAGVPFFDFQDIRALGGTDEDFQDGIHPGEGTCARCLQRLGAIDPVVRDALATPLTGR